MAIQIKYIPICFYLSRDKCVEDENLAPGYEGCYSDVLNLAHRKCSGKNTCQISIPDPDFEATKPCSELQNYLETKYGCIAGNL